MKTKTSQKAFGFGKVIIFGEHLVVQGLPALVASLDLCTHAEIREDTLEASGEALTIIDNRPKAPGFTPSKKVEYNQMLENILNHVGIQQRNFSVILSGSLPVTCGGIGASAATAVAFARAVNNKFNLGLNDDQINQMAFVGESSVHGTPSGIDNTAATFGGAIKFCNKDKFLFSKICAKNSVEIVIIDSGRQTDTKSVVADVREFMQKNPEQAKDIFKRYENIFSRGVAAIEFGDFETLGLCMNQNHELLQAIARVNRPYNELKEHGLVLDYYGIFDNLNDALNYRPEELGDVAFPFDRIREHFRKEFDKLWALFPEDVVPRDGSHSAYIAAMKILRDEECAEKQFDTGYRNVRVLYEALQPDEQLRDFIRPYAWLTKLYLLYRAKFYPEVPMETTEADAARTKEMIREHIDVEELKKEFPTYVLDEHFLTKLKDKKPDAKALDIEAMLSAELRIRLDQDDVFRPLSEKLQRIIDEKRAGTLAGIALIEELESLTEAVRSAVE